MTLTKPWNVARCDETLVICGDEFGRTPAVELVNGKPGGGRDHNHWGFTV